MLIDARELPAGFDAEGDVCIVGAGPAGITVARELAARGVRVCLLESGEGEPELDDRSVTQLDPDSFQDPSRSRLRGFGGNAPFWKIPLPGGRRGVRLVPFDAVDFEPRPWLPHSGWPFDRAALDPYYERAQEICAAGPFDYNEGRFSEPGSPPLPLDPERVESAVFQVGGRDHFYTDYREQLSAAKNVSVYLGATAVEVETAPDGDRVLSVRARTPGGELRCRARRFVPATGAIENARLLLLSNGTHESGLGKRRDTVGRYFMDHPIVLGGPFVPAHKSLFDRAGMFDLRKVDGTLVIGRLGLPESLRRREQLMAVSAVLFPRGRRYDERTRAALAELAPALSSRNPRRVTRAFGAAVRHPANTLSVAAMRAVNPQLYFSHFDRSGWSAFDHKPRRLEHFEIVHQTEQAPDPDNRVTLGDERDAFGQRRARLSTRWLERDIDSIVRTQAVLAQELARAGVGRFTPARVGARPFLRSSTSHHHMGTTRMHDQPEHGVVDAHCRVHDLSNLFVAGSSVFPTGSYANPTLTVVAMAVRLADHLRRLADG